MRQSPGTPHTAKINTSRSSLESSTSCKANYEITLVTPMYGGGYIAGRIDTDHIIRESSIRGQLRFWWRATRGAKYTNVFDLRKHEIEIFGDTTLPSNIRVTVILKNDKEHSSKHNTMIFPKYALFFGNESNKSEALKTCGITFFLTINYKNSELKPEVEAALWAWINFGGLGSRTRRGCGSLYSPQFSPKREDIHNGQFMSWFEHELSMRDISELQPGTYREWPTLSRKMKVRTHSSSVNKNWHEVIEAYKLFRGRANKNNLKRSFWPEADSIRALTDTSHPKHKIPFPEEKEKLIAFPRAEFGLPIIFKFRKNDADVKNGIEQDPKDTELLPVDRERLTSPVILKPLAYSKTGAIGVIAVLNHPPLEEVELKQKGQRLKELKEGQYNSGQTLKHNGEGLLKKLKVKHRVVYKQNPLWKHGHTFYNSAIEAFLDSWEVRKFCQSTNFEQDKKHYKGK
ncbi:CRISPR-associated protein Cmr1 [Paenibacillus shirakamiensis]|uniref:CRISPR-associated protein Cmr1 n=1 Tax=Paenibacillus shirakamiensis TaxID=1265935 RepID=A0ABS4JBJ2_9BACL|nr:type III-B CRISPR module RAMP protein Cmr1 [Paenibacillus shirakamiensis]MBP1999086.1 CRISPR-associated protein Cmr1 [Paenibacillus shirakamiensis]